MVSRVILSCAAAMGIAILNGVVLTSYIRKLERAGLDPREAATRAAEMRPQPAMMTALGFLPMALSFSAGPEVQRPPATKVIGGLISATLLTLVILPAIDPFVSRPRLPFGGNGADAAPGRIPGRSAARTREGQDV